MMLDRKVMSIQKSEIVSGERRNTRSLDLCVPILSMSFGKVNGAKANLLGQLFGFFVRGRKLVLRANAIRFS